MVIVLPSISEIAHCVTSELLSPKNDTFLILAIGVPHLIAVKRSKSSQNRLVLVSTHVDNVTPLVDNYSALLHSASPFTLSHLSTFSTRLLASEETP